MICPNCGKSIPDDAAFCPHCGVRVDFNNINNFDNQGFNNVGPTNSGSFNNMNPVNNGADFRSDPNYKKNLIIAIIASGIALIFGGLSLLGSLLMRFGDLPDSEYGGMTVLFVIGFVLGIVSVGVALAFNKKVFKGVNTNIKMKGAEFLIPLLFSFAIVTLVMALGAQGLYLLIY